MTVMLQRIQSLCAHTAVPVQSDRHCPVSLYTPDQAIGLQLDYVWVLGLDDQSWPPAPAPDPFLPYALQRERRLPGASAELQQENTQRQTELLTTAARRELILSYHSQDQEFTLRPAQWLTAVAASEFDAAPTTATPSLVPLETISDDTALPLSETDSATGDSALVSWQSSCPFSAFTRYRLQTRPLEEFAGGLTPAARGTAVHKVMEYFWSRVKSQEQLLALSAEACQELVDQAAKAACDELHQSWPEILTPKYRTLEQQRLAALLSRFLEEERQRLPFTVRNQEQQLQWEQGPLRLRLKSDRIDSLADGSLALLDYKSGKQGCNPAAWLEDRPLDLQLPLYHYAVARAESTAVSAVAVAQVNAATVRYSGFWIDGPFHPQSSRYANTSEELGGWPALQQRWHEKIDALAAEYIQGVIAVAPTSRQRSCQYCGLDSLCRITELDNTVPDDEDDTVVGEI